VWAFFHGRSGIQISFETSSLLDWRPALQLSLVPAQHVCYDPPVFKHRLRCVISPKIDLTSQSTTPTRTGTSAFFRTPAVQVLKDRKMAQIQLKVAGDVAVEALKAAMTTAGIEREKRAYLIGYFCNEWNTRSLAIADAKVSEQYTERAQAR
jgi:hypothetical protein